MPTDDSAGSAVRPESSGSSPSLGVLMAVGAFGGLDAESPSGEPVPSTEPGVGTTQLAELDSRSSPQRTTAGTL